MYFLHLAIRLAYFDTTNFAFFRCEQFFGLSFPHYGEVVLLHRFGQFANNGVTSSFGKDKVLLRLGLVITGETCTDLTSLEFKQDILLVMMIELYTMAAEVRARRG